MQRTTVVLPEKLKSQAFSFARKKKQSFNKFLQEALEKHIVQESSLTNAKKRNPFYEDVDIWEGPADSQSSIKIDDVVYGENIHGIH